MRILFVHQKLFRVSTCTSCSGWPEWETTKWWPWGSTRWMPAVHCRNRCSFSVTRRERGNTEGIHPLVMETETKIIRAEGCARAAEQLKAKGFIPDLICAHPGWGEALFLKAIWPDSPLLCYQDFFYNAHGFDSNFDPEFDRDWTWREQARLNMKNAYLHLTLEQADWNVSPTHFQASSFPEHWQRRISVIHDGVDTQRAAPVANPEPLTIPDGTVLENGQPIVTFVNRRLEPYRGCHTFLRAIPDLQRHLPEARIVIVGETKGVSYGAVCPDGEWKDQFLAEIEGQYDPSRVHFTGTLPYEQFLPLLQLSACHVYLTYPFVMSWSLLEAMACGCAVVGSDTAPVREVIRPWRATGCWWISSPRRIWRQRWLSCSGTVNGLKRSGLKQGARWYAVMTSTFVFNASWR